MQKRLDELLRGQGYQFLKVNPPEAGVYYRLAGTTVQVVLGMNFHAGFQLDVQAHQRMKQMLENLFLDPQKHGMTLSEETVVQHVEIFTVILTDQPARAKLLCEADPSCWILDIAVGRLLIYENQQSDFYGLYRMIQQLLEETEREGRQINSWGQQTGADSYRASDDRSRASRTSERARRRPKAVVNICLVVINVIIFIILSLLGDTTDGYFMSQHGAIYPDFVLIDHRWILLFTNIFVHFGFAHLLNNMVVLLCVGEYLERWMGSVKYLVLYLLSGIGASLVSLLEMWLTGDYAVSGGASGAIFGVIGALLWVVVRNKGRVENLSTRGVIIMIALSLYFGFTSTGVDNSAHIGGLVAGFILGMILYRKKKNRS